MARGKEETNIIGFYALMALGLVLNFVPSPLAATAGLFLVVVVLIAAYIARWRASLSSLTYNHMCFLITTFWIGSTILFLGVAAATGWVYLKGDHTALYNLREAVARGAVYSEQDIELILRGYMTTNMRLLVTAGITTLAPGTFYFLYRIGAGLSRVRKGENLPAPAAWFKV